MGLEYKWNEGDPVVFLQAMSLRTDETQEEFADLQYCDLLSPYRAIEWIYANSLRYGLHS